MKPEAWEFFYEHAGYGYNPATQSAIVGRVLGAIELARAEAWAKSVGVEFTWEEDYDGDRSGIEHDGPLYCCVTSKHVKPACPTCGHSDLEWSSLGGIDLGEFGYSRHDPYVRVVQAELASDLISRLKE